MSKLDTEGTCSLPIPETLSATSPFVKALVEIITLNYSRDPAREWLPGYSSSSISASNTIFIRLHFGAERRQGCMPTDTAGELVRNFASLIGQRDSCMCAGSSASASLSGDEFPC